VFKGVTLLLLGVERCERVVGAGERGCRVTGKVESTTVSKVRV